MPESDLRPPGFERFGAHYRHANIEDIQENDNSARPPDESFTMPASDAEDYLEQASGLMKTGRFPEAIALYETALGFLERTYGEDQPQLAECLQDLSRAYEAGGRLNDALRIHTRRLRLGEEILGQAHPTNVETLFKLTQINETLGRPADALFYCDQALQTAKQCLPQDAPLSRQIVERYNHLTDIAARHPALPADAPGPLAPQGGQYRPVATAPAVSAAADQDRSAASNTGLSNAGSSKTGAADAGRQPAKDLLDRGDVDDAVADQDHSDDPPPPAKPIRSRRIETAGSEHLPLGRLAKDFALPFVALLTVSALISFFVLHKNAAPSPNLPVGQNTATADLCSRYSTADTSHEVYFADNGLALIVTAGGAMEVPYVVTAITNWNDLVAALTSSLTEKQIWAAKRDSQLKTEDDIVYYSADGPEAFVLTKMRRLAGYAQAYFLRAGAYPKVVPTEMISLFCLRNPLDGTTAAIPIKTLLSQSSDGVEAKAGLDSGLASVDGGTNSPCKIICYAVIPGESGAKTGKLKATKFLIRGCDRNGLFLSSAHVGQTYVMAASDRYLVPVESEPRARPQTRSAGQESGAKSGQLLPKSKGAPSVFPPTAREKPKKTTRLWIISDSPCPLWLIHRGLPLLLLGLALAAFVFSQMTAVDIKGRTLSSGSGSALFLALICLILALVTLVMQFWILS